MSTRLGAVSLMMAALFTVFAAQPARGQGTSTSVFGQYYWANGIVKTGMKGVLSCLSCSGNTNYQYIQFIGLEERLEYGDPQTGYVFAGKARWPGSDLWNHYYYGDNGHGRTFGEVGGGANPDALNPYQLDVDMSSASAGVTVTVNGVPWISLLWVYPPEFKRVMSGGRVLYVENGVMDFDMSFNSLDSFFEDWDWPDNWLPVSTALWQGNALSELALGFNSGVHYHCNSDPLCPHTN